MMKLKVNRLHELASSLPQSGKLSTAQQLAIRGGDGDEDTRNPPGGTNSSTSSQGGPTSTGGKG